jgi:pimeloyl-ACP methyl ester carboxylesterase
MTSLVFAGAVALTAVMAPMGVAAADVRLPPLPEPAKQWPCDAQHLKRSLCGPVTVPLDRSGRVPGDLRLRVLGRTMEQGRGTLLVLDGTTHGNATERLGSYSFGLESLGRRRVVTFDMRGTGASRLTCRALRDEHNLPRAVADCAALLGSRRAFFTVADDVADTEAVRAALGVERMTIYGFDYGARVAVAYATVHPDRVERLVLDSPEPLDGPDPSARSSSAAIRRIAAAVCAHACRFTHDSGVELAALLDRAARGPLHARAFDGRGRAHDVPIGPAEVRDVLLAGDVSIVVRVMWPPAVHAALAGAPALLARLVRMTAHASPLRTAGGALRLARMCGGRVAASDGLPAIPPDAFAPFDPAVAGALSPSTTCASWPDAPSVPAAAAPPAVPTLVRSGEHSLTTPLEDAQALAARIPGAQLLTIPLLSHELLDWSIESLDDCPENALRAFGRGKPVRQCPRSDDAAVWPIAPPRSLADVSPRRGLPERIGRTVHAVQLSMLDAVIHMSDAFFAFDRDDAIPGLTEPRVGGLHGGFERVAHETWTLRRYSYVPGVTLTGTISSPVEDDDRSLILRIGGSEAVHGVLDQTSSCGESTCFVGWLGGHRIQVLIPGTA